MPGLVVFAEVFSLRAGFCFKSLYQLFLNYTINLPLVINTHCFSQGHLLIFMQTGGEGAVRGFPENCSVLIHEERQLPS